MEISPVDTSDMTSGQLREYIWTRLMQARAAAYPLPPTGHHPNFKGASDAAQRLLEHLFTKEHLKEGMSVLSYPDYVLKPVRKGLLERGITVIVPAKYGKGYRKLEPEKVNIAKASSISGAEKEGLFIKDLPAVEMAFIACVAISQYGKALGKGYGFRLAENIDIACATIVHPLQITDDLPEYSATVTEYATPEQLETFY